jgi:hypothetical protein
MAEFTTASIAVPKFEKFANVKNAANALTLLASVEKPPYLSSLTSSGHPKKISRTFNFWFEKLSANSLLMEVLF